MVVLKGIPALLSPELLFALAKMGHGDEIVLADANFPTSSICRCGPLEVRADGLSIPQLLESILKLLPLDTYEPNSVVVMDLVESDKAKGLQTPDVWQTYKSLLSQAGFSPHCCDFSDHILHWLQLPALHICPSVHVVLCFIDSQPITSALN
ncbi:fucose mutarotase isoform X2 [Dromiciops gliroides]|uniref:fucose mutarotase isoform X2 n=1 Tax=Dromiciops gliroides TaxID=33562 RepID=UPI001CC5DCF7|nr:fucose mutarotase isoform X2 [Dromiciops gliroides]